MNKEFPHSTDQIPLIVPFTCTPFGRNDVVRPTVVHNLTLPYIDYVAALGDSITAGFGAKGTNILNMFTEYRGVSWSIGGDASISGNVLTLANLIKLYNPNVRGFSTGTGGATSANANYNQAVSGAVASDLVNQAMALYNRMRTVNDFATSYKLITIFIGGNDLCAACNDYNTYSTANYIFHIKNVLGYIKQNFNNVIVNLVPAIDVTELSQLTSGLCSLLHAFECSCGTGSQATQDAIKRLQKEYVIAAQQIASAPEWTTDSFAVILQPFMARTFVPKVNGNPDMSFFAMDCFHLSEKGHQAAAVAYWNNIWEKFGKKLDFWEGPREQIDCPTSKDFIWTSKNSN